MFASSTYTSTGYLTRPADSSIGLGDRLFEHADASTACAHPHDGYRLVSGLVKYVGPDVDCIEPVNGRIEWFDLSVKYTLVWDVLHLTVFHRFEGTHDIID